MSRPLKLTDEVQEKICEALRQGNFRAVAAAYAGVGYTTVHKWLAKGRAKPRGRYGAFRRAVLDAESLVERRCVAVVIKAGLEGDVKSAQWWLEHKARKRWANTQKHELSGPGGKPIEVKKTLDLSKLTPAQLDALISLDPSLDTSKS